jgi:tripartite-type tricarboxylate transporter receptor subunit TctC
MLRIFTTIGCFLLAWIIAAAPALSKTDFFAGKTITYIVATKAGGGYDTMGRLVAKYLEKHLAGSKVVVKNVPGAGHLVGAQSIYAAKPDGLTIGTFNTGLIYSQLTNKLEGVLDLSKMSWIGKAASESRVMMVAEGSDLKSIDDLKRPDRQIKISASGKGSSGHFDTAMLAKIFGFNVKIIFGFEGTEGEMSLLRGEIDAVVGSRSSLQHFVDSGKGRFILEIGGEPGSTVPQLGDLAKTDQAKSVVALIVAQAQYSRATAGPGGIPEEQLKALREAYIAALTDPDLLAEAAKAELPIAPASGADVAERMRAALNQPPENLALMKAVMEE